MAEVPEDRMAAAPAARVSAYALTRATVAQDEDEDEPLPGVGGPAGRVTEPAGVQHSSGAARVRLASEGYDVVKVLRTLDQWIQTAATGAPAPPPVGRREVRRMTDDAAAVAERDNRVYADHVLLRATLARDVYTMERVMARWASGDQAAEFISAVAKAGANLARLLADQDEVHALEAADRLMDFSAQHRVPAAARAV